MPNPEKPKFGEPQAMGNKLESEKDSGPHPLPEKNIETAENVGGMEEKRFNKLLVVLKDEFELNRDFTQREQARIRIICNDLAKFGFGLNEMPDIEANAELIKHVKEDKFLNDMIDDYDKLRESAVNTPASGETEPVKLDLNPEDIEEITVEKQIEEKFMQALENFAKAVGTTKAQDLHEKFGFGVEKAEEIIKEAKKEIIGSGQAGDIEEAQILELIDRQAEAYNNMKNAA